MTSVSERVVSAFSFTDVTADAAMALTASNISSARLMVVFISKHKKLPLSSGGTGFIAGSRFASVAVLLYPWSYIPVGRGRVVSMGVAWQVF